MELRRVEGDRRAFLPLLLEADESESVVLSYLEEGELFSLSDDGIEVGVVLLISQDRALEIRNIAVDEASRGRGVGTRAIEAITDLARDRGYERLLVGTASQVSAVASSTPIPTRSGRAAYALVTSSRWRWNWWAKGGLR